MAAHSVAVLFDCPLWVCIMAKKREGYSLVELIIVVMFLGIFAAIAVPRFNFATISRKKADCQARKIVTDLRRTRALAISDAANNTKGFELNMLGSAPYSAYEIVNRDTLATVDSHTIDSDIRCTGQSEFRFGPLGNLVNQGHFRLTVAAKGKNFRITVIPATGTIKCSEN